MSDVAYWRWFTDLALVAVVSVLAVLAFVVPGVPWPIRWTLGLAVLVFVPGYAVVAAVFPERSSAFDDAEPAPAATPSAAVVVALSMVGSALLAAVVGTAVVTVTELTFLPVAGILAAMTVVAAAVAAVRRALLAPYVRRGPLRSGALERAWTTLPGSRNQNVAFLAAGVVLLAAVGVTAAFPPAGDPFTEFYVLNENADGDLVAEDYPDELVAGDGHTFHVGVENHEHTETRYSVVVLAQSVGDDGTVTGTRQLDAFEVSLAAGEKTVVPRDVAPEQPGEDVRLVFLLYKGDAPATPGPDSADFTLQIWTDVVTADNASATDSARVDAADAVARPALVAA
ncbi:DUF1616 domain-containing protein [Halorubellus sp. PRR65]|uniref:DUF1616 domain-containing protein n=1 Tax=Halorubellus sp. PRR65 TaxID=3098148 RepID=UPI002B258F75|nr:DUF1616 domain-containing protein [Halorubellus sp. PRR65]